uniref:Uncharacterized protein n=1 Tax=Anguilla anguilla TaxID=7936 RepID=A0A0E9XIL2_ANGAN
MYYFIWLCAFPCQELPKAIFTSSHFLDSTMESHSKHSGSSLYRRAQRRHFTCFCIQMSCRNGKCSHKKTTATTFFSSCASF